MSKNSKLDDYHYHEMIDRFYIAQDFIEQTLSKHPVCQRHKKIKNRVAFINQELINLYQVTVNIRSKKFNRGNK